MRNPLFQLVGSGALLGLMCGVVMIHAIQIRRAEQFTGNGLGSSMRKSLAAESAGDMNSVIAPGGGRELFLNASAPREEKSETLHALRKIVEQLQELESINQSPKNP